MTVQQVTLDKTILVTHEILPTHRLMDLLGGSVKYAWVLILATNFIACSFDHFTKANSISIS